MSSFEQYFSAVKDLRTEYNYRYTDKDLETYSYWIKTCFESEMSCYLCLEMLWLEIEENKKLWVNL